MVSLSVEVHSEVPCSLRRSPLFWPQWFLVPWRSSKSILFLWAQECVISAFMCMKVTRVKQVPWSCSPVHAGELSWQGLKLWSPGLLFHFFLYLTMLPTNHLFHSYKWNDTGFRTLWQAGEEKICKGFVTLGRKRDNQVNNSAFSVNIWAQIVVASLRIVLKMWFLHQNH